MSPSVNSLIEILSLNVRAGQQAVYRNRPAYDMPADHAGNATAAAVNIHRMAATRHNDFSFASSSLTTVLLASLSEANEDTLHTTFPDLAPDRRHHACQART
jgi:hypothetical protein